ncbi:expressed unknown protein [Seminavis robusta]|uniref:Uncharacterized protein n=1 Tax=Seminavis robusta TaxID=568900 RepID=A0A9N8DSI0_9STRA|nr:expressed unknown protein [Seminavis robusta]|eukprot:Sro250_g098880.1 n/a (916) ;mRNA; f:5229-7976
MLILLLVILVTSHVVASETFVPLCWGQDHRSSSPLFDNDILRGYKLNIAEGGSPLRHHVFEGEIEAVPSSNTLSRSLVIKTLDDIKDVLEIEGSLGVSYGPMTSREDSAYFLQSKVASKQQVTSWYRSRHVAYAKAVDVNTLKPMFGVDLLDGDEIADHFGSKFIDQIIYGAQLDVVFTLTSSEDIDMKEVEAELKRKIGVEPLSDEFQANFKKQDGQSRSKYEMTIVAQACGVDFSTPTNPSFEQVNELIDDFNSQYNKSKVAVVQGGTIDAEQSNILEQFSPIGFTLSSIADYLPNLNEVASDDLGSRMTELREVFHQALFWEAKITAFRNQQELIYLDSRSRDEMFEPYNTEVSKVLHKLEAKIEECLEYRSQPMATIVGSDETKAAKIPDTYPSSGHDEDALQGLVGAAFIPSPVTVGKSTFDHMHYIGFALPNRIDTSSLNIVSRTTANWIPWMAGTLLRDQDNSLVATGITPESLERQAYAVTHDVLPFGLEYLHYGEEIFFQSGGAGSRWLNGLGGVHTANPLETGSRNTYQWNFWSELVSDDLLSGHDPKHGQCLKYGDKVYLNTAGLWLRGGIPPDDSNADGGVETKAFEEIDKSDLDSYVWIVRSTFGSGVHTDKDPALGQCVQNLNRVYLQLNVSEWRWLCGATGAGTVGVDIRNVYDNDELGNHGHYEWIMQTTLGNGSDTNGFFCAATAASGSWTPLKYSADESQTVSVSTGIKGRNIQFPYFKRTSLWDDSVAGSVGGGFHFGRGNLDIDWLVATELVPSAHEALGSSDSPTNQTFAPGQVWQFVFEISDTCAPKWELRTGDLVVTEGPDQEPCCLPGFETDNPHGRCRLQSPCQCEASVCYPPVPKWTVSPTDAPIASNVSAASPPPVAPPSKSKNIRSSGIMARVHSLVWLSLVLVVFV